MPDAEAPEAEEVYGYGGLPPVGYATPPLPEGLTTVPPVTIGPAVPILVDAGTLAPEGARIKVDPLTIGATLTPEAE